LTEKLCSVSPNHVPNVTKIQTGLNRLQKL